MIHNRFSTLIVIFAGLHLAINWDWSVLAARKIFGGAEGVKVAWRVLLFMVAATVFVWLGSFMAHGVRPGPEGWGQGI